ncbi:Phytochrome-like protein cph2 [Shimia sp. SK013]|uniref:GGDEF domain-containing protein n=1 Tax=Shimia sp. SK013 TaxID=1389006 RepID=UPI0006B60027|nr:diguanylate cyclase [Shimia sp. SK013]KPA22766.1 Phytochrome-like protein cph2 [Shimia sp. SK013]
MLQLMRRVHFWFVFIISAAVIAAASVAAPAQQPEFDLRHIDFRTEGQTALSGDWFFSHGSIMTPVNAHTAYLEGSMNTVAVPNSWNAHLPVNADNPHHAGYGSYVARVRLPKAMGTKLVLDVLRISDSYEIYWIPINAPEKAWRIASEGTMTGPLVASHGYKGHTMAMADDGLILINVRGEQTSKNGITEPLTLYDATTFQILVQMERLLEGILIGFVLIVGALNFSLFFFHRKDAATLVLTLAAAAILFRMISVGGSIETVLGPEWRGVRLRLETANIFFLLWTATLLNQALLWQHIRNWRFSLGFGLVCGVLILICAVAPLQVVTDLDTPITIVVLVSVVTVLIGCGVGILRRVPNAGFFFISWLAMTLAAINDATNSPYFVHTLKTLDIAFVMGIMAYSIQVGRRVISAINRAEFLEEERTLLQKLHQDAVDSARLDHLTGLLNRLAFDTELAHAWLQHEKEDEPLSLILFDIDHFKSINDSHGHQVGDRVLQSLASLLKDIRLRKSDRICRYGGEEFALILPETSGKDARKIAERIRKSIAGHTTDCSDDLTLIVTCSFGVASATTDHSDDPSRLLERADAALYRAKANGRNRVECHRMPNTMVTHADPAHSA